MEVIWFSFRSKSWTSFCYNLPMLMKRVQIPGLPSNEQYTLEFLWPNDFWQQWDVMLAYAIPCLNRWLQNIFTWNGRAVINCMMDGKPKLLDLLKFDQHGKTFFGLFDGFCKPQSDSVWINGCHLSRQLSKIKLRKISLDFSKSSNYLVCTRNTSLLMKSANTSQKDTFLSD